MSKPQAKPHRLAIIGIGGIAAKHADALAELDHAHLVAGVCRTRDKGQAFAQKYGCDWYDDPESMLDQAKPDVVALCTPSGAHLEPMLACAARGIHVLCEKPMEITTARIDQMIAAADDAGIRLGGVFPMRYSGVMRAVHDAAAAGRFGDLAVIKSDVPWWREDAYYAPDRWQGTTRLDGGGAMMNQSIHGVDLLQWIAGATHQGLDPAANPVAEVFAYTAKRGHPQDMIEVEDVATAVVKFQNGALGSLLGTTAMYPGSLRQLMVGGRDGTAEVREDELVAFEFRDPTEEDAKTRAAFSANEGRGGAADPLAIGHENHRRNIAAFLEALDADKPLDIDAPQARKAVAIIEALYRSAQAGKPVAPA